MPDGEAIVTQVNVRLPWALAAAAKRLAAKHGMSLNTFYASLLEQAVWEDAEALRTQLEAERADVLRENAALLAVVEQVERANEEKAQKAEAAAQSDKKSERPMEKIQQ
jgi:hypothetical protein